MSFAFSGATSSFISRTSGNPADTDPFTICFWIKRTANFSGTKYVVTVRPTGEADGHDTVINDPSYTAYSVSTQANYATTTAGPEGPAVLNTWEFWALVGSGANISLKRWNGSTYDDSTVGQTAFTPNICRFGDDGYGSGVFTGLIAHIRMWDDALSESDLTAERTSVTHVQTTSLVSVHSGTGANIAAALTGESGTAFTNGGAVTLSVDDPSIASFTGVTLTGTAALPSETVEISGARYNYCLYSSDMTNAVWVKQSNLVTAGSFSPPSGFGNAFRVDMTVNTGGVYQRMTGLPVGRSVAAMAFRKGSTDYVVFKHVASDFASGAQGFFSFLTGTWVSAVGFGGVTLTTYGSRSLGGGWYLVYLVATIVGDRIMEFFPTINGTEQVPAASNYLFACGAQYEGVASGSNPKATFHKPTTSAAVSRTLSSAAVAFAIDTIGAGQTVLATATLIDSAGDPWDQYGPLTGFASSDPAKATIGSVSAPETDTSGRVTAVATGVAAGSTNITFAAGGVTSPNAALTVVTGGSGFTRSVEILVESGWTGTSGWNVGVYEKHGSARFPTTKLFEAANQTFEASLTSGQSRMVVPVPTSVSVSAAQVVEVVIENDNVGGRAVDGPGIFEAVII